MRRLGVDNGGNLHVLHRDRPLRLSRKSASAASRPRRCAPSTAARRIFTPLQNPLTSLTFDNYSRVLDADDYRQSITNSLIVSGIGAILVAAIAVAAAVVAKRSTFRFSKTIEYLALGAPRYEAAAAPSRPPSLNCGSAAPTGPSRQTSSSGRLSSSTSSRSPRS